MNNRQRTRRKADRSHESMFLVVMAIMAIAMMVLGGSFGYVYAVTETTKAMQGLQCEEVKR